MGTVVELRPMLERKIQFDGTNWNVWLDGKKIRPNMTKVEAGKFLTQLNDGALEDILNLVPDLVESAFDEQERKNGNK